MPQPGNMYTVFHLRRVPKKANAAEKNGCAKEMDMQTASIVFLICDIHNYVYTYVYIYNVYIYNIYIYTHVFRKGILVAWLGEMNCKCCLPEHGKGVRVPSPSTPAVQERTHFGLRYSWSFILGKNKIWRRQLLHIPVEFIPSESGGSSQLMARTSRPSFGLETQTGGQNDVPMMAVGFRILNICNFVNNRVNSWDLFRSFENVKLSCWTVH